VIGKLLVANRGEIARRVIRSAHSVGITCVAVCSDPDAAAPHVREADEYVRLPGSAPADTYLNIDALIGAAQRCGADAVHPGYGFLSEDARFARACLAAGLVFVGPPPDVIETMGSKLAAKAAVAAAGVPVLPTVEIPLTTQGRRGHSAPRLDDATADRVAALGWPVLVKASAGGGGRGMRVVDAADSLGTALDSAAREALAAFGDGTLFIEPYVERPRHVEVQILADRHGNIVHLFERECSIQRRHQKIVEECPSPAVDATLRTRMGAAAVTVAGVIGYVNAGTVEFLLLDDGTFAFLEVNTRLQVEHPVTECVTGLDLVRLQLQIADGWPLPVEVREAAMSGHAIEARLYAEDATRAWQPSAGRIRRFDIPSTAGVRVDSGVEDGSEVPPHYDSMLAKVIAHAPTRLEAARALAATLERARVHGVTTNRELLVRILRHPDFLAGTIDTGFLDRHDPALLGAPLADAETRRVHAAAAALAAQAARHVAAPVLGLMPSGWRNNPSVPQQCTFEGPDGSVEVAYRFDRAGRCCELTVGGVPFAAVEVTSTAPDHVVVSLDGVSRRYDVDRDGATTFVDGPDGSTVLVETERFPLPGSQLAAGALTAPLPGTVVKVAVARGDLVAAGDTLVAIEAMKMEHEVRAPTGGTVAEVHVYEGDQVEAGRLLVVIDESAEGG
jgi:propionyl-CoA carboxylase alpha chain